MFVCLGCLQNEEKGCNNANSAGDASSCTSGSVTVIASTTAGNANVVIQAAVSAYSTGAEWQTASRHGIVRMQNYFLQ